MLRWLNDAINSPKWPIIGSSGDNGVSRDPDIVTMVTQDLSNLIPDEEMSSL